MFVFASFLSSHSSLLHWGGRGPSPALSQPQALQNAATRKFFQSFDDFCGTSLRFLLGLLIPIFAFATVCSPGQDWPQWGGAPARNMYSPAKGLPDHFTKGKSTDIKFKGGTDEVDPSNIENLKWVAKLGSQSYGNVTVAKGKVFIGTNNEPPRDPRHQGDRSILLCFDEKTGELIWQLVIPKLASGKVNDWESLGLLSSPTIEGDRVYVVTSRCEVLCLDVNG